jgi:hypothetical protein
MIYIAVKGPVTLTQGSRLKLGMGERCALYFYSRFSRSDYFVGLTYLTSRARGAANLTIRNASNWA